MFQWAVSFWTWLLNLFFSTEMELTLVGLQSSGKSTFVNVISNGQFSEEMLPTVGFNMRKVKKGNVLIKMWDIGGQPRFRLMWERYCRGVNAIIYMVDSADRSSANIESSRKELHFLLSKPHLEEIPVLVLGNKNDCNGAMTVEEIIEFWALKEITNREVCCYSISCKDQTNLNITLKWLLDQAA